MHQSFALSTVLPGADFLDVRWTAEGITDSAAEAGIFFADDVANLFQGPPVATGSSDGAVRIEGLATGPTYHVGIAVREDSGVWVPSGAVFSARTAAPVYADPAADPGIADGQTPGTAFNDVFLAVVTAFSQGGGNVWIAEGEFDSVSFPLLEDVSLYGGFASGFVLEERDPAKHRTILNGLAGPYVVRIDAQADLQVVEGVEIAGRGGVVNGIDLSATLVQMRALTIGGCTRGLRLRNSSFGPTVAVTISGCAFLGNSLEGVSLEGALDLSIEHSSFLSNGAEGFNAGALVAPEGGSASLLVRYSFFADNGADGLDADIAAPAGGGSTGGRFDISLEDSDFVGNAGAGAKIDLEYEAFPVWRSEIVVRGCKARANGLHGMHLDLDSTASAFVHRVAFSANEGDGLQASSETAAGFVTVSTSLFQANAGAGIRATFGNFPVIASHCVLAGNFGGGFVSDFTTSVAVSTLAYLQPSPWTGIRRRASLEIDAAVPLAFDYPPTQYLRVLGASGSTLTVATSPDFDVGAIVEIDDDEIVREATAVGSDSVTVDPPPGADGALALTAYAGLDSVSEDWRLSDTSPAIEAGMSPPGGALVDAGIFGAPLAGDPGAEDLIPAARFHAADLDPAWGAFVASDPVSIGFAGGVPDPASLSLGVFVVDEAGLSISVSISVQAGRLFIDPPVGGWHAGLWIELFPALLSTDGAALSAPIAIDVLLM